MASSHHHCFAFACIVVSTCQLFVLVLTFGEDPHPEENQLTVPNEVSVGRYKMRRRYQESTHLSNTRINAMRFSPKMIFWQVSFLLYPQKSLSFVPVPLCGKQMSPLRVAEAMDQPKDDFSWHETTSVEHDSRPEDSWVETAFNAPGNTAAHHSDSSFACYKRPDAGSVLHPEKTEGYNTLKQPHEWFTSALDWYTPDAHSAAGRSKKDGRNSEWFTEAMKGFVETAPPPCTRDSGTFEWFTDAMKDITSTDLKRHKHVHTDWFGVALENFAPTRMTRSDEAGAKELEHDELFMDAIDSFAPTFHSAPEAPKKHGEHQELFSGASDDYVPEKRLVGSDLKRMHAREWFSEAMENFAPREVPQAVVNNEVFGDHEWFAEALRGFSPDLTSNTNAEMRVAESQGDVVSKDLEHHEWFMNALDSLSTSTHAAPPPVQKNEIFAKRNDYWGTHALVPVVEGGGLKQFVLATRNLPMP